MRAVLLSAQTMVLVLALAVAAAPAGAEVRATEDAAAARPGGALEARGSYNLDCWQAGTRVLSDKGKGEIALPTPATGGAIQVLRSDGGRTLVILDGHSLCRVVTLPVQDQ